MSRTAASIAITLACALAQPAFAQPAGAKGGGLVYTLEAAGKSGVLLGAQGLAGPEGGLPGATKSRTVSLPEITLTAGTGLPPAFYAWISAALEGKPMPFAATVHAADANGRSAFTAALANPRLVGVAFGALDEAAATPMHMDVRMQAALKIEPNTAKAPKADPHAAAARWRISGYRLALGSLDTRHVPRIGAITLGPGTGAQLELTTNGATAQAFGQLAPTGRRRAARPIEDGRLDLLGADGAPLATLELRGVQVTSLYYGQAAAPRGPRPAVVTIVAQRADLKFAPAISR